MVALDTFLKFYTFLRYIDCMCLTSHKVAVVHQKEGFFRNIERRVS